MTTELSQAEKMKLGREEAQKKAKEAADRHRAELVAKVKQEMESDPKAKEMKPETKEAAITKKVESILALEGADAKIAEAQKKYQDAIIAKYKLTLPKGKAQDVISKAKLEKLLKS